ncbi:MAG: hypothetical protein JW861_02460, partial [Bacteroidales bacterium]|nr:hypothetical protein [Bacteroidales bacterium]
MKKATILITALMFMAFGVSLAQPELYWRFANEGTKTVGTDCVFEFDIELACSQPGTFHSSTQIYFDYNTAA